MAPPLPRLVEQSAKRAIPNREVKRTSAHDIPFWGENKSSPGPSFFLLTSSYPSTIIIGMASSLVNHLNTKEVFITTWTLFRRYYKELILLALLIMVLQALFQQVTLRVPVLFRGALNTVLIASILYLPQAFVLFLIDKKEHKHSIGFSSVMKQFAPFIVSVLLVNLALNSIVTLGFALFIAPGILALIFLGQAPLFVLLRNASIGDAFGKSAALTKGNRMNFIKIWFLFILIGYLPLVLLNAMVSPQIALYFLSFFTSLYVTVITYALWIALQKVNPTK